MPLSSSPEYSVWEAMVQRCTNPKNSRYKDYGGRGISVSPEWRIFKNFFADMGKRPGGLTLERIDNNLGYSRENCRWATYQEQNLNRRIISRNKSGVTGVYQVTGKRENGKWVAEVRHGGVNLALYRGFDFFAAVCARKSYDAKRAFVA